MQFETFCVLELIFCSSYYCVTSVVKPYFQFQHRVGKEYHDRGPRINLTFRTIHKK